MTAIYIILCSVSALMAAAIEANGKATKLGDVMFVVCIVASIVTGLASVIGIYV
jgi:hypothetical protein